MNLKEFSKANLTRCIEGFGHALESWSPAEWTNAMAGELGEACNLTKKLLRHRDGIAGNVKKEDQNVILLRHRAAKELCDAIIYADLSIQALGFDTDEMLREVWNAKSIEIDYEGRV